MIGSDNRPHFVVQIVCLYPFLQGPGRHETTIRDQYLKDYLVQLSLVVESLSHYLQENCLPCCNQPVHKIHSGDWVHVRSWTAGCPLEEKWKGPFQALLTTYTLVKVDCLRSWTHHTRLKKTSELNQWTVTQASSDPDDLRRTEISV